MNEFTIITFTNKLPPIDNNMLTYLEKYCFIHLRFWAKQKRIGCYIVFFCILHLKTNLRSKNYLI